MTTILGIDPGYGRLGWAIGKKTSADWGRLELGCIETAAHRDTYQRYQELENELQKVIDKYQPDEAAIETLFFSNNQKTAMQVAESRGIILAALIRNKLPITQYNPMEIKETVTGNGRADKKAVEKMIRMEFKLGDKKVLDDAIDALAVVLTHSIRRRNNKYYA
jgi:crossover junction endodeoxyribonuclease RuvC